MLSLATCALCPFLGVPLAPPSLDPFAAFHRVLACTTWKNKLLKQTSLLRHRFLGAGFCDRRVGCKISDDCDDAETNYWQLAFTVRFVDP